ncbi:MAG TPA: NUDIX domain-containing protein [Casimicrobiaceae bacterium]
MARAQSAGVVLYRRRPGGLEVLLVHPGGPYWAHRDEGAWSIPKGEFDAGESAAATARREFTEETGFELPAGLARLTPVAQSRGKTVHPFAAEGDVDPAAVSSNTFTLEWPPRSGRFESFPEIDRAAWFSLDEARRRIVAGQRAILDELRERLGGAAAAPRQ